MSKVERQLVVAKAEVQHLRALTKWLWDALDWHSSGQLSSGWLRDNPKPRRKPVDIKKRAAAKGAGR